jgi:hypothetical protein
MMKLFKFLFLFISIVIIGSSCVYRLSTNKSDVPVGYYCIAAEVRKPGLISCNSTNKTLTTIINEAGGLTDYAYRKRIVVRYTTKTNEFDLNRIRSSFDENPLIPCCATVFVRRIFD